MIGEKEARGRQIHVVYPQMDRGIHKLAKLNGLLDNKKTERIPGAVQSVQFAGVKRKACKCSEVFSLKGGPTGFRSDCLQTATVVCLVES